MGGHHQGRQQPQTGLGGQDQQAPLPAGGQHIRRADAVLELDAQHQAQAGDGLHMGQLFQAGPQLGGVLPHTGQEALVQTVHHHVGAGADHRVAAKGGAVAAGTHPGGHLLIHQDRADGQAAPQALGQGDDVGPEVELFTGQEGAGAAHAGLGAGLLVHQLGQRFDVSRRGVDKAVVEGSEVVVEGVLAGGGQGGQGPAVEAVHQGDDLVPALAVVVKAVFPGCLDGALVGLGPRIAEEHLAHAGAAAQPLGQLGAGSGVVEVGGVLELVGLLGNRLGPVQVAVAQAVHPDAAGEVQIILALGTIGVEAVALLDDDGVAVIGMQDVVVVPRNDFLGIHLVSSLIWMQS